jgi:FKBP-type peptidyl-prolyl cis-trans isomerase (trigger factor)
MMRHIGMAMKAGHKVTVTFRKPYTDEEIAGAAEIGEVLITNKPELTQ